MHSLRLNIQWKLVLYDAIIFAFVCAGIYMMTSVNDHVEINDAVPQYLAFLTIVIIMRLLFKIYHHIWRFEGVSGYILLIAADFIACVVNIFTQHFLPWPHIAPTSFVVISSLNLVFCLFIRMTYRYIYKTGIAGTRLGKLYSILLKIFGHKDLHLSNVDDANQIKIAIYGAGRTGTALATGLQSNPAAIYKAMFFIDKDPSKTGKIVCGLKVYEPGNEIYKLLKLYGIKEVVIAIPELHKEERENLFEYLRNFNCKVKMYDYSTAVPASNKNQIRDFDIEDLMSRKIKDFDFSEFKDYYENKSILITGGGGSIGSEIARQITNLKPSKLILLDIYENGVYDLQQELLLDHKNDFGLYVEIASVTDKETLDQIFEEYKPDIVIHAAAHKHVPLMEHNSIEAINNNVFGTKNLIEAAEKYKVDKVMMVSTDKAVNPTNIMGATKRFCEIMFMNAAQKNNNVNFGATRFGNVLGSAGSVVPLFRRQIENGGPVTVTHKDIIRYFMTIPEASNLVLHATAMTKNGELFVLDMGQQVKIYDLAKKMIKISGVPNIEIVETGLRPGEKLYEEILINMDNHERTENKLIFIEKSTKDIVPENFEELCAQLKDACEKHDSVAAIKILKQAIPEYKDPNEVNKAAMQKVKQLS